MQLDLTGRTFDGLQTFLAFIALNIVFLACCVPVVSIPAGTCALYEVVIRYSDEERGRPLRDFFVALKRNALRATFVGWSLLIPAVAVLFSAAFWASTNDTIGMIATPIAAIASMYLVVSFLYGMALTATHRDRPTRTIRNALLLPGAEPLRSVALLLLPAMILCLIVLFPPFVILVASIACSAGAYASAFLFRAVFARRA